MASNTPTEDDQSPPDHPSFITPPLVRPRSCIPVVTQTQSPENEVRKDETSNTNSDEDTYGTGNTMTLNWFTKLPCVSHVYHLFLMYPLSTILINQR